ncbi:MAG TPA: LysR substrate-binding domain-containing protein [Allosphingosinicella sp.]|nr:LysR substrate-binding domain-containing protein [Allosphingosinicella sp.]
MVEAPRLPSLASIHAFEAAARLGSFARAGRELGTSAASVSYHVRQLETQIGATLFRRLPHRVELTEAGRLIAGETIRAFGALRASFVRAAELDNEHLALTTLPTFGTSWLVPLLGDFRALHPEIRIDLDLSADARDLSAGRFDAAIRNGHGDWPGLRAVNLFPSLFMPLCAPALLAEAAETLRDPGRNSGVALLGRPDWWRLWYRALGAPDAIDERNFGLHLADEHLDAAAAIAGGGIVIGSPILFAREMTAGRLVPAHQQAVGDGRAFWLTFPVARRQSPKIEAFRRWLTGHADRARAEAQSLLDGAIVIPSRRDIALQSIPA